MTFSAVKLEGFLQRKTQEHPFRRASVVLKCFCELSSTQQKAILTAQLIWGESWGGNAETGGSQARSHHLWASAGDKSLGWKKPAVG